MSFEPLIQTLDYLNIYALYIVCVYFKSFCPINSYILRVLTASGDIFMRCKAISKLICALCAVAKFWKGDALRSK